MNAESFISVYGPHAGTVLHAQSIANPDDRELRRIVAKVIGAVLDRFKREHGTAYVADIEAGRMAWGRFGDPAIGKMAHARGIASVPHIRGRRYPLALFHALGMEPGEWGPKPRQKPGPKPKGGA